jgi:signal peptidase II
MGLRRPAVLLYVTAALVFLLDRSTKWYAVHSLSNHAPVRIIPGVLQLTYTTNSGGAFGMFDHVPWLFALATVVVSIAIVRASLGVNRPLVAVALGLILGGALGNLADRISGGISLSGRVVDFIDFRIWPVFNLADSAIVVGALLLIVATASSGRRTQVSKEGTADERSD